MSYTVKEVARIFDVNPETVRRWIRTGRLEATIRYKKEGARIEDSALESFVQRNPQYNKNEFYTEADERTDDMKLSIIQKLESYKEELEDLKAAIDKTINLIEGL